MIIAVLKERKFDEHRGKLQPFQINEFVRDCHLVMPENSVGFNVAVKRSKDLFDETICHWGKLAHEYSARKKKLEFTRLAELV
ncbi:MAG TPA: hypothetical protein ENN22_03785 [bacterium]|nr:hypothetical protein [bacterium]